RAAACASHSTATGMCAGSSAARRWAAGGACACILRLRGPRHQGQRVVIGKSITGNNRLYVKVSAGLGAFQSLGEIINKTVLALQLLNKLGQFRAIKKEPDLCVMS